MAGRGQVRPALRRALILSAQPLAKLSSRGEIIRKQGDPREIQPLEVLWLRDGGGGGGFTIQCFVRIISKYMRA